MSRTKKSQDRLSKSLCRQDVRNCGDYWIIILYENILPFYVTLMLRKTVICDLDGQTDRDEYPTMLQ